MNPRMNENELTSSITHVLGLWLLLDFGNSTEHCLGWGLTMVWGLFKYMLVFK